MKRLKSGLLVGMVCFLLVTATSLASGEMISLTSAAFNSGGNASFTVAVPQFDASLGTLTGATITLNMNLTPSVKILNYTSMFNGPARPLDFQYAQTDTLASNGASPVTWTNPYGTSFSDNYFFSVGTLNGPVFGTVPPITPPYPYGLVEIMGAPIPEVSVSTVPAGALADYVGNSTVDNVYQTSGAVHVLGQGTDAFFGGTRYFAGTATVQYTFTPVPEPATMSLLMIGGMLGLLRTGQVVHRRRKASA